MSRRAVLTGLAASGTCLRSGRAATAAATSAWVASGHARVRLIDAGPQEGGRLAGLQIGLDPGYLTYWRTPGEAGLPPTTDFSGSDNVASAVLRFPAPDRYDEGGAEAFGYKNGVVFPIAVSPREPGRPVTLSVTLSFAICRELCLPAGATVRLGLDGPANDPEAALVRAAERLVPAQERLGAAGPLAILAVEPGATPDRARVLARAPSNAALFVEASDPWYVRAGSPQTLDDGRVAFELQVLAGPTIPTPASLVLTLTTDDGAVETAATWVGAAKS